MIIKNLPFQIVALAVIGLLFASPTQTQAQGLGIAAGANFDSFSDINHTANGTLDNATGFHAGIFVDLALGPVSLRPGLYYVDVGELEIDQQPGFDQAANFDLSLIEVPVDVRYRIATPIITPYLLAGPVLRFANADDDNFQDSLRDLSLAGAAGAGIEVAIPGLGFRLYPEVRYQFGVTQFIDDFEVGDVAFTTDTDLNTVMLRLGVTF